MRDRLQLASMIAIVGTLAVVCFAGAMIALTKIRRQIIGEPLSNTAVGTSNTGNGWYWLGGLLLVLLASAVATSIIGRVNRRRVGHCAGCGMCGIGLGEQCPSCGCRNSVTQVGSKGFDVLPRA